MIECLIDIFFRFALVAATVAIFGCMIIMIYAFFGMFKEMENEIKRFED